MPNEAIRKLTRQQCNDFYAKVLNDHDGPTMRRLCREDLFFLLVVACKRKDMNREWIFQRIRMVEADPDDNLDLWFREGYKSSIITFGLNLQDILKNPEVTIGIFSHTRPIAKAFLFQLKSELEKNEYLKDLFPDILWRQPHKESPKWSLDDGIIVKRKGNPKESTVEAWGLVDAQPTSKHFDILNYDDIVVPASIGTPEMIAKVLSALELSYNLASKQFRRRFAGTRYHAQDAYQTVIDRGTAKARIFTPTDKGQEDFNADGVPVIHTVQELKDKRRDQGLYTYACQMLQNPFADKAMNFKKEWLEFYSVIRNSGKWNFYILVDPASKKKKDSDYTVILVIGLAPDHNYYLMDGVRDRLNLTQRSNKVFELHRKWQPLNVGYEEYGMQADIEHIKYVQEQEGYRFQITPLGGSMAKEDRIRRLVPIFEQHRFYMPFSLLFVSAEGKVVDLIQSFLNDEYHTFPVCSHDDIFDCTARIVEEDLHAVFPLKQDELALAMSNATQRNEQAYDVLKGSQAVLTVENVEQNRGGDWKSMMTNKNINR